MAARDDAIDFLRQFGLDSLITNLDDALKDDPTIFSGQYGQERMFRSIKDTVLYKTRFAGMALREKNGYKPISEKDYLAIEKEFDQTLRTNGMPKGFYDKQEDFASFIGNDVRADELNTRIQQGYKAVYDTEPGTKEELKRLYGLEDNDIAAFLIDPTRFKQSEAVKKAEAARRANAAREQGMQLTAAQSEELVNRGIGQATAQQGFQQLAATQELFNAMTAGETAITQEEQIAGVFGTNAEARKKIEDRKRKRTAAFQQGGSLLASQTGNIGLGTVGQQHTTKQCANLSLDPDGETLLTAPLVSDCKTGCKYVAITALRCDVDLRRVPYVKL